MPPNFWAPGRCPAPNRRRVDARGVHIDAVREQPARAARGSAPTLNIKPPSGQPAARVPDVPTRHHPTCRLVLDSWLVPSTRMIPSSSMCGRDEAKSSHASHLSSPWPCLSLAAPRTLELGHPSLRSWLHATLDQLASPFIFVSGPPSKAPVERCAAKDEVYSVWSRLFFSVTRTQDHNSETTYSLEHSTTAFSHRAQPFSLSLTLLPPRARFLASLELLCCWRYNFTVSILSTSLFFWHGVFAFGIVSSSPIEFVPSLLPTSG
jgi:hypothetical protein